LGSAANTFSPQAFAAHYAWVLIVGVGRSQVREPLFVPAFAETLYKGKLVCERRLPALLPQTLAI
jgi:hypothetical protein